VKRRPPEPIAEIGWIQTDCHDTEWVVPEAKVTKNRVHLDVAVQDVDAAASRVIELGGTKLPYDDDHDGQYQPGSTW